MENVASVLHDYYSDVDFDEICDYSFHSDNTEEE